MGPESTKIPMSQGQLDIGLVSPFRLLALARKKLQAAGWSKSRIDGFMSAAGQSEIIKYSAEGCPQQLVQRASRACVDTFRILSL